MALSGQVKDAGLMQQEENPVGSHERTESHFETPRRLCRSNRSFQTFDLRRIHVKFN